MRFYPQKKAVPVGMAFFFRFNFLDSCGIIAAEKAAAAQNRLRDVPTAGAMDVLPLVGG